MHFGRKFCFEPFKATAERKIWKEFERITVEPEIQIVPLDAAVLDASLHLLDRLPPTVLLRTLDALHLATAIVARSQLLATTDKRMQRAARLLKIKLM